jgi:hypothetical protein
MYSVTGLRESKMRRTTEQAQSPVIASSPGFPDRVVEVALVLDDHFGAQEPGVLQTAAESLSVISVTAPRSWPDY